MLAKRQLCNELEKVRKKNTDQGDEKSVKQNACEFLPAINTHYIFIYSARASHQERGRTAEQCLTMKAQ